MSRSMESDIQGPRPALIHRRYLSITTDQHKDPVLKPIRRGEVIDVAIDGVRHREALQMLCGSLVGGISVYTGRGMWGGDGLLVFGGEMGVVRVGMR